jgi:hypothetical protein
MRPRMVHRKFLMTSLTAAIQGFIVAPAIVLADCLQHFHGHECDQIRHARHRLPRRHRPGSRLVLDQRPEWCRHQHARSPACVFGRLAARPWSWCRIVGPGPDQRKRESRDDQACGADRRRRADRADIGGRRAAVDLTPRRPGIHSLSSMRDEGPGCDIL